MRRWLLERLVEAEAEPPEALGLDGVAVLALPVPWL